MPSDQPPSELTTAFAALSDMLLSEQDATAAVEQLAEAARQTIPAASGAGVSLFDDAGHRTTRAATDDVVDMADALQYRLGEGPCLSAWATSAVQLVADTAEDGRWRAWQRAATDAGIRSVISVPLIHRGHALGALKVYADRPGAFGDEDVRVLGLLADAAATLLGVAQDADAPVRLSASLKAALASRETIALATGVLMARDHVSADAARITLLKMARARHRRLADVAADLLRRLPHERR